MGIHYDQETGVLTLDPRGEDTMSGIAAWLCRCYADRIRSIYPKRSEEVFRKMKELGHQKAVNQLARERLRRLEAQEAVAEAVPNLTLDDLFD